MPIQLDFPSTNKQHMKGVAFIRQELVKLFPIYRMIRDCLSGETAIKAAKKTYLPMPCPEDTSLENSRRYTAYITRAVFYNVTERTLLGLVGQIFMREPTMDLPPTLQILEADASADGMPLDQVARTIAEYGMGYGRAGVFIDYPEVQGPVTRQDVQNGTIRPSITVYPAWQVKNWRTQIVDGVEKLILVVIWEGLETDNDGFESQVRMIHRELRLVDGVYQMNLWESTNNFEFTIIQSVTPVDASGKTFDSLPFVFVGSNNNNASPDKPPMSDMASLNVAHYRNSADYEEMLYLSGQATPVFTGLSEDWVKNILKGVVAFGSRTPVMLPIGAEAKLLEVTANSILKEAMDAKERQMVALGAKLVQQTQVQRTATEADIENTSDNSVLANVARNTVAGIEFALNWCARFTGDSGKIEFDLATEFDLAKLDPQERTALIKEYQNNVITFSETRQTLRRAGIAYLPDEDARTEIEGDMVAQAKLLAQTQPTDPAQNNNNPGQQ